MNQVKQDRTEKVRQIVLCSGVDAQDFLHNLLTCKLPTPEQNTYGLLLNNKGRITYDFFLWCYDECHYLFDCCQEESRGLAKSLAEHAVGRAVKISLPESLSIEVSPQKNLNAKAWSLPDPRLPEMGWRTILQDAPPPARSGIYTKASYVCPTRRRA